MAAEGRAMASEFTVEDVAYELRRRERDGVRCALLIGAGCSYQAGIPLAQGFVDRIAQDYPREYARAPEKTYPECMAQLARSDRHKLVCEYVDKAKINWAHISIAQLMRRGFIDRVLTTNFDPLVVRACALLNLYPAVYDMAVVRKGFVADYVRDLAVFHLHGQRDGFIQLHDQAQVEALRAAIEPLFDDTAKQRTWLVVGYSGQQDPVFEALADRPEFPNRLFWVGYRDEQPSAAVRAALIDSPKDANWIAGYDPDTFLLQLASKLDCFPPGFFARPFSHLLECFQTLAGFRLPGSDQDLDWAARARGWIEKAQELFEIPPGTPATPPAAAAPPPRAAPPPMPSPAPSSIAFETLRQLGKMCGAPVPIGRSLDELTKDEKIATRDVVADADKPAPTPSPATSDIVGEAWTAMMSGDYAKVIALAPEYDSGHEPQIGEPLAWALSASARALAAKAAAVPASERDALQRRAEDYARRADAIRPGLGAAALKP